MLNVTPERTGWRDQRISLRHRNWGVNCPATDLDFLLCEYQPGSCIPKAIVEYKHEKAPPLNLHTSQCQVLANLGNLAKLPTFCVRYADDFSTFTPVALNGYASRWFKNNIPLPESEYVNLLYRLRGALTPLDDLARIRKLE